MKEGHDQPDVTKLPLPVTLLPTPTREYATLRHVRRISAAPFPVPTPVPIPIPPLVLKGPRVLVWKQDPSVSEIGVRKAYLPFLVQNGPRDLRSTLQGMNVVNANVDGDFIQTPGTDDFDAVHTFAVVTMTRLMYQRALGGAPTKWQWNSATNVDPINIFPHAGETPNAFYQRATKSLRFFFFNRPGVPPPAPRIFTCRSFDIVAHETGHAILDGLKPHWIEGSNTPQTGALHESFGDITAIFLALSQMDQVEAVIAQTKGDLHNKSFLADLAEEFGLALGRPNGLRNADNDLKLSQVTSEVHDLSQVFTGAIYDILADIYAFETNASKTDLAKTLYDAAQYVCSLVLRAIVAAPDASASFADVANKMLSIATADGKPAAYLNAIRNRFTLREVVVSLIALTQDYVAGTKLEAAPHRHLELTRGRQNRSGCCGTMQLPEYNGLAELLKNESKELAEAFK